MNRAVIWREALDLARVHRGPLTLGVILMLVSRAAALVLPATSKYVIDDVIGHGRRELLPLLAAAIAVATVIQAVCGYAVTRILGLAAHRAIADARKRLEQHVIRLPVSFFATTRIGVLISRIMNDAEGLRNIVGTGMVQFAGAVITSLFAAAVLFSLNARLTLTVIAMLVVIAAGLAFAFRTVHPLQRERVRLAGEISGRVGESLSGVRVVKAYTAEKREDVAFAKGIHRQLRLATRAIGALAGSTAFVTLVGGTLGIVVMVVGARAILGGTMTVGDLVMYVVFTGVLIAPLSTVTGIGMQFSEAFAGLARIRELLQEPQELADESTRTPVASVRGDVEFDDVSFEYVPGVRVLDGISFVAPQGTVTALVGPSGGGKSTLVDLILSFIAPKSGRVLIDGRDLAGLRLRDYRAHVGVVLQEIFLFDGSIAENLLYSRPGASRQTMLAAARAAHVDDFVLPLKDGYDTIVGERGIKLSAGQRQRIAIARAILAQPSILILDEATSSLDSESEAKVQAGLQALIGGRTTFVIAHRLSTVRRADQILVLDRGMIVERGTHASLIAAGGRYKALHDQQMDVLFSAAREPSVRDNVTAL